MVTLVGLKKSGMMTTLRPDHNVVLARNDAHLDVVFGLGTALLLNIGLYDKGIKLLALCANVFL